MWSFVFDSFSHLFQVLGIFLALVQIELVVLTFPCQSPVATCAMLVERTSVPCCHGNHVGNKVCFEEINKCYHCESRCEVDLYRNRIFMVTDFLVVKTFLSQLRVWIKRTEKPTVQAS